MDSRVQGRYLGVRLFLEGVEVDVTSVKVSCGVNVSGTATLTIPAVDEVHKILPRTLVHVFYFDSRYELGTQHGLNDRDERAYGSQKRPTPDQQAAAQEAGESVLLTDKNDWRNWKLLFVGEVMGYSFKKVGSRREILLGCRDHTSYWANCRLYWGKKSSSVFNAYKTAIFSGATQLYRGTSKVDDSKDLLYLLQNKPSSMPNVPGLLGGIFSLLESATGCFSPDADKKFLGCNDFMSQAEVRLKLTRQVGASSEDDTSATFTASKSFKKYLLRVSKQATYTATFIQFLNMLMGKIYHVWNSQSAPPYFSDGDTVYSDVAVATGGGKFKKGDYLYNLENALQKTYELANKQTSDTKKRRGEVSIAFERDFMLYEKNGAIDVATHKAFDDLNIKDGIMSSGIGSNTEWFKHGFSEKGPLFIEGNKRYDALMKKSVDTNNVYWEKRADKVQQIYQKAEEARNLAAGMYEAYRKIKFISKTALYNADAALENATILRHNRETYYEIRKLLEEALGMLNSLTGKTYKTKRTAVELRDRLLTTFFHPDLFMVPPPKCNVLFPDHIQSISFSRNWMSEITRLWLHGRTESGRNKKDCYFSPNSAILGGPSNTSADQAVKKGASFLMNHEKWTGIIPSIVGLGDADIFKTLHTKGLAEARKVAQQEIDAGKRTQPFDDVEFSGEAKFSPQPHLQRAANYMFVSARYSTRTMEVTCKYSPQIVVGMPALVLDPLKAKSSILAWTGDEDSPPVADPDGNNVYSITANEPQPLESTDGGSGLAGLMPPKGTHYIGMVAGITHVIDVAGGAQTLISLVKCREHNETAGLFGEPDDDGLINAKRSQTKTSWKPLGKFTTLVVSKTASGRLVADTDNADAPERILGDRYNPKLKYRVRAVDGDGYDGWSFASGANLIDDLPTKDSPLPDQSLRYPKVWVTVDYRSSSTKSHDVKFTWEASVLPPWFSNIYNPKNIGPKYYQKMYGCNSIVDDPPIKFVSGVSADDYPQNEDFQLGTTVAVPFSVQGGTEYKEIRIPLDLTTASASAAGAADQLADVWLALKEIGANTDKFIDGYVDRKFATLLDVMGNQNPYLKIKTDFSSEGLKGPWQYGGDRVDDAGKPVFTRGFHGDAYGDYTNFIGVDGKPLIAETLTRLTDEPSVPARPIDSKLDPRSLRYQRVVSYVNALRSQGFRNIGGTYDDSHIADLEETG